MQTDGKERFSYGNTENPSTTSTATTTTTPMPTPTTTANKQVIYVFLRKHREFRGSC